MKEDTKFWIFIISTVILMVILAYCDGTLEFLLVSLLSAAMGIIFVLGLGKLIRILKGK